MSASFHPYAPIIASASRRPERWRLFAAILALFFVTIAVGPVFYTLIGLAAPELRLVAQGPGGSFAIGTTPGGLFTILSGFAITLLAALVLARRLHARGLRDLTGPAARLRRQFVSVLKWVGPLVFLAMVLPWDTGAEVQISENLPTRAWLFWLPFAVLGIMIQITAEEIVFRGYLQSQIIAVSRSYAFGLVASALLFGLGHISSFGQGAEFFPVIWATGFGLLAGDLTARSGTIGPACALHFINNAAAMLLVPQASNLSGFGRMVQTAEIAALYTDPKVIAFETILLVVTWLAARLALRR
ncbi:CPBP family intramembrane glutamic endopeptidase [Celeribacter indicus]|uniref:CAAX amino terminal protease-like protein n=1 Tax=Celeribacter indicus TaxID=1208324 RepID=A0A0B5DWZ3_9RHOB|nr:CPBP family intramembrane glutamic endopeptidase [Celeribacter indicus]AJE45256.1 CAAX amino terminal protease-like protein [Celeribacter indicus]